MASSASPARGIKGLVSSGQAGSETWLPVPALSASGGRRALYGTVALSPQLVHLEPDEAQAAREHLQKHYPGTWVHVPMEAWSQHVSTCLNMSQYVSTSCYLSFFC